ncbi:MAG: DUF2059 domain-containing protein [Beijerinckiaceae bacterium]
MKRFAMPVFAALVLLAATGAIAQQAPATATAPAPPLPPLTESHLTLAREVVIGSGLSRSFEGMSAQIADQMRVGFSRQRPELIKDFEEVLKPIVADMSRQSGQMITSASTLFARRLTEAELKDISTFFKSPAGQKYVTNQPQLLNDLFAEMQVFSQTMGNIMSDRVRDEMRKKGHQL